MKQKILLVAIVILLISSGFLLGNRSQPDVALSAVTTESTLFYRSDIASTTNVTVTTNQQIFATSSTMIYRRIVNNCSSIVFIQDASDVSASLTSGFGLSANGGTWTSSNDNFIYTGAVNASSTDETSCDLHTIEY